MRTRHGDTETRRHGDTETRRLGLITLSPCHLVSLSPRLRSRAGYTLLELVLVLAIMVILAAMIYPSAESMYGHLKLSQGADTVRDAWAAARAHAINEGRPYRFAIIPGQGNLRIAPDSSEYWAGGGPTQNESDDPDNKPLVETKTLPKGLRFSSGDSAPPPVTQGPSSIPEDGISPDMWSTRTVFLADGTATDDVEVIFGADGTMGRVLKLRALTGAVTARQIKLDGRTP
jgi:prepilin-type N-terminal cleavage/methylation domain-containing protein